ncbi:ankyrin repeat domain-containing protein [Dechloromonas sp.]|uniref:ankyrin repeat domain-containing protein n=1 Tax=Dechloromonas sp. TaxID=1917218 RepID=UPI00120652B6|nr:ankyrin repeat domain-containing protein [Dechloromonas sp.]MBU3697416.1 ankyrin repeat domain-containing protein [Dechloromonas sp.]TEX49653.1 MAG: hypothetical protein CFR70_02030 [Rhodocyclaceae bacterium]
MTTQLALLKAIRTGNLAEVRAVLDSGVSAELIDGQGDPGLPMGIACFMGFADIVRELFRHGARVNVDDNAAPTSPLSMALRGKRTEVVRTLLELGLQLPPGTQTGLSDNEVMLAQWKSHRDGHAVVDQHDVSPVIEEIDVVRCLGTDTQVLEADVLRAARGTR